MAMIRFDVNCALGRWPDGGPTYEDAAQLTAALDRLGIERALVRHRLGQHHDAAYANALLLEQAGGCERLIPCLTGLPPIAGELGPLDDWLAMCADARAGAVILYPASHGYPLTDWQLGLLPGALAARRVPLLLETSEVQWDALHRLMERYAELRVVLLSSGYRVLRPLYALLEAHPQLYLDLSTLSNFCGIETLVERFGAERFLFGTGQPRADGAGIVAALNYVALNETQKQAILAGNLAWLIEEVRW